MKEGPQGTLMGGGFLLGAAIGAGLALLFAPAAGSDTRRHIGSAARNIGSGTKDKLTELKTGAMDRLSDVKTGAMDKLSDVRQSFDHSAHDVSAAVKEGRDVYRRESQRDGTPSPSKVS